MWENLSRDLLDRVLPCQNLVVSSGFIQDEKGFQSKELDCILANTHGLEIPRTDKRMFSPKDVIAVIQVKKVLYQKDIKEGFENLWSLIPLHFSPSENSGHIVKMAFESIARTPLPKDLGVMPLNLRHLYSMLLGDTLYPCRILIGYYGFKDERTFRKGLFEHIKKLEKIKGWGPVSFPNFVLGPNAVAMKNSAMPWAAPLINGWWPFLATSGNLSPGFVFLEAIWTRLNHLGILGPEVFGEDSVLESWNRFIDVDFVDQSQYQMRTVEMNDEDDLKDVAVEWAPVIVSHSAFILANMLCDRDPEPINISDLGDSDELNEAFSELQVSGIAARDITNPSLVYLLTASCGCVILSDGRYAIGENNTGQLARWVERNTQIGGD